MDRSSIAAENLEETPYSFGVLMKWGKNHRFMPVGIPEHEAPFYAFLNYLKEQHKESGGQQTVGEYLASTLVQQFQAFINREGMSNPIDMWNGKPQQKAVLELLDQKLETHVKDEYFYDRVKGFWIYYCEQESPIIRKPAVFAATLEYMYKTTPYFGTNLPPVTQKYVAKKYGVSPNSISKRKYELEDQLFEWWMKSVKIVKCLTTPFRLILAVRL